MNPIVFGIALFVIFIMGMAMTGGLSRMIYSETIDRKRDGAIAFFGSLWIIIFLVTMIVLFLTGTI